MKKNRIFGWFDAYADLFENVVILVMCSHFGWFSVIKLFRGRPFYY